MVLKTVIGLLKGPNGSVINDVKNLIIHCIDNKKPIVSLCISPTVIAKFEVDHNPK